MFERRVRLITSYNYSSDLYERVLKKKYIIIYGASVAGKLMKDAVLKSGRTPLFFWDINPNSKVDGFEVKYPDFEVIDKADRADCLVIMAIDIGKSGYWFVREKLIEHGYPDYVRSPELLWHINAMNCYLKGDGIEDCKKCPQLYWQCFCLNDKYTGTGFDKGKLLWPCVMSIKYENKEELAGIAGRCEKFCGYFSATQSMMVKYKALEDCGDEFYSLVSVLIERIKVGVVQILCVKSEALSEELLSRLSPLKSRIHFLVDHENGVMLDRLSKAGFSNETTENTGFAAISVKEYNLQCSNCVFKRALYHLNGGSTIGYRCEEMFNIISDCDGQNILDIDAEQSVHSPDFAKTLENVTAAEYFYGKCGCKTVIREKGV